MPTTLITWLRRPVTRLKPDETCTWERHLHWNTAARSLWRTLNKFDSVKRDGVCHASIVTLQKKVAKFDHGKRAGTWSYDRIRHLLAEFESAGLIGPRFVDDEGEYEGMLVFQVHGQHMHDQLCQRERSKCRYRGWQYAAWLAKKRKEADGKGPDPGTGKGAAFSKKVAAMVADEVAGFSEKSSRTGSRTEMPQPPQNENLQPTSCSELSSSCDANQLNQVSHSQSEESSEPPQSSTKSKKKAKANQDSSLPVGMTDQNQKPQPCEKTMTKGEVLRKPETIGEHFGDAVSIEQISNGEIDWDELDKKYRYTHISRETMEMYCRAAVDAKRDLPYLGPKTHGMLMVDAMRMLSEKEGRKAPECWYPVAKALRDNPPVFPGAEEQQDVFVSENGASNWNFAASGTFEMAARNAGIDITPFLNRLRAPNVKCYRDGWQYMAGWSLDSNESLGRLRDWLFEKDPMPHKPAVPPWKK